MRSIVIATAVAAVVASTATADLINPVAPTWRGEANSQYFEWNAFSEPTFAPNDPSTATNGDADLSNFATGAFIGSNGEIHSDGGLDLLVRGFTPGAFTEAVVHVTYITFDPQPNISFWNGITVQPNDVQQVFSEPWGRGESRVTERYTFDLSGYTGPDTDWRFYFDIDGPNTLEGVSVDVRGVVPSPGVLATLALAGFARRRRRG